MRSVSVPIDTPEISTGNANTASKDGTGWLIGRFMQLGAGRRRTNGVEVKWGVHQAGERRERISAMTSMTSLAILVHGNFAIEFPGRPDVILAVTGDYVVYGPGILHGWRAIAHSTVITVRWPADPLPDK